MGTCIHHEVGVTERRIYVIEPTRTALVKPHSSISNPQFRIRKFGTRIKHVATTWSHHCRSERRRAGHGQRRIEAGRFQGTLEVGLVPTIIDVSNNYRVLGLANPSSFNRRRCQGASHGGRERVQHHWTKILELEWTGARKSLTSIGKLLE